MLPDIAAIAMEKDIYDFDDEEEDMELPLPSTAASRSISASAASSTVNTTLDSTASSEIARMGRAVQEQLEEDENDAGAAEEAGASASGDLDVGGPNSESLTAGRERYPEGLLLWAKLKGYSYWPSVVTVDPMDPTTYSEDLRGKGRVHVHFIGYANQRAWVNETSLLPFQGRDEFLQRAARSPKARRKDFVPTTPSLRRTFEEAAVRAEEVRPQSHRERLETLGYVYVRVSEPERRPSPASVKTAAQRKFPSVSSPPAVPPGAVPAGGGGGRGRKRKSDAGEDSADPKKKRRKRKKKAVDVEASAATSSLDSRTTPEEERREVEPNANDNGEVEERSPTPVRRTSTAAAAEEDQSEKEDDVESGAEAEKVEAEKDSKDLVVKDELEEEEVAEEDERPHSSSSSLAAPPDDHQQPDVGGDDSPQLGTLIWGRMPGFPYWPCFVTSSPDGDFCRRGGGRGGRRYHVQFFNWNEESGWVSRMLPWCSLDVFRERASRVKRSNKAEWRDWHPNGKVMAAKWEQAYREADLTTYLSRKERHDLHVVDYDQRRRRKLVRRGREEGFFFHCQASFAPSSVLLLLRCCFRLIWVSYCALHCKSFFFC